MTRMQPHGEQAAGGEKIDSGLVEAIFAAEQMAIEYLSPYGKVLPAWENLDATDWKEEFPDQSNGVVNKYEPDLPSSRDLETRMQYDINEAEDYKEYTQVANDLRVRLIERDSDNPQIPEDLLATPGGFKVPELPPGMSGIKEYGEESTDLHPQHKQYTVDGMRGRRAIPIFSGYSKGDPGNRSDKIVVTTSFALFVPWEIAKQSKLRKEDQPEDPNEKKNARNARDVSLREILDKGPEAFWSPHHYHMIILGAAAILRQQGYTQ